MIADGDAALLDEPDGELRVRGDFFEQGNDVAVNGESGQAVGEDEGGWVMVSGDDLGGGTVEAAAFVGTA